MNNLKNIKKIFYALFVLDILAGAAVWNFVSLSVGIITSSVLLFINLIAFAIIVKIIKVLENGKKQKN
jgi:hypothetical protein